MDTLIDKREFPKEMQEQYKKPEKKAHQSVFLIVLTIIAIGVIVFLVYRIFIKKNIIEEKESYTVKEQVDVINNFNKTNPKLTEQKRQEKINVFFNN